MARVNNTVSLRAEYSSLFSTMEIKLDKLSAVENHVKRILKNEDRYKEVAEPLNIPWYFVALIHGMESNYNFKRHLHNGDPLTARTRQVPKGRPKKGTPPFTWEESAIDALKHQRINRVKHWSLPYFLYELESYNGWGYRLYHPHVLSPYLWSYSNHYTSGKYVADGRFSDTAVSKQSGAAVVLKRLIQRGIISLETGVPSKTTGSGARSVLYFSNRKIARAMDLQRFLNTFDNINLLVDGKPGNKTSEACKHVLGCYLSGDKRKK